MPHDRIAIVGQEQRGAERTDDPSPRAPGALLDRGVEAVLFAQLLAHAGALQTDTRDAPGPTGRGERVIGVDRLVRAVKCAETEVDDADVGWNLSRPLDVGRQSHECVAPQTLRDVHVASLTGDNAQTRVSLHQPEAPR